MNEGRVSDALELALALFANPALVPSQRSAPIPADMGELLRVASGQQESLDRHSARLGETPERLMEAARFFVEQMMLAREVAADPWRVLGAERGAPEERLRENRHWLLRLVHPDRSSDWADAYADRVQRAWREVRNPAVAPVVPKSDRPDIDESDWNLGPDELPIVARPIVSLEPPEHEIRPGSRWGRWSFAGFLLLLLGALIWGPQLEDSLRGDELAVFGGAEGDLIDSVSQPMQTEAEVQSAAQAVTDLPQAEQASEAATRNVELRDVLPAQVSVSAGSTRVTSSPADSLSTPDLAAAVDSAEVGRIRSADSSGTVHTSSVRGQISAGETTAARVPVELGAPERISRSSSHAVVAGVGATPAGVSGPAVHPRRSARPTPDATVPTPALSIPSPVIAASLAAARPPEPRRDGARSSPDSSLASVPSGDGSGGAAAPPNMERVDEPVLLAEQPAKGTGAAVAMTPSANQVVAPPPRPAWPTIDEARQTVAAFQRHYGRGDLVSLVNLFAADANPRRGGLAGLHADYAQLFGDTDTREIAISALRWQPSGNVLVGNGRFEAKLARKGRLFKQRVSGAVRVEVVSTEHGPRLFNLVPVEGG